MLRARYDGMMKEERTKTKGRVEDLRCLTKRESAVV